MQIAKITSLSISIPQPFGYTVDIAWRYGTSGVFTVHKNFVNVGANNVLLEPESIYYDESINPTIQIRFTFTNCDAPTTYFETFTAAATTTLATTQAPEVGNRSFQVNKDEIQDEIYITIGETQSGTVRNIVVPSGVPGGSYVNVMDSSKQYSINIDVITSGRDSAPMSLYGQDGMQLTATFAGTNLSLENVQGQDMELIVGI